MPSNCTETLCRQYDNTENRKEVIAVTTIHLFAGANSSRGFFSHYQYLAMDSLNRVFILKGGPGTGKSTIIQKVSRNYPCSLEKYHCTAASDSLDGLFIPSQQVSIIDGTSPHTIDPHLPGAVQQVIDLGRYWDEKVLIAQRKKIQDLVAEKANRYKAAYGWLAVAGGLADQVQQLERTRVKLNAREIAAHIKEYISTPSKGIIRHAFATGITADGFVSFLPSLKVKHSFALVGGNRAFNSLVLVEISRHLSLHHIPALYLYCGLQPQHLEHIYIPGELAIFSSHQPHLVKGIDGEFGPEYTGPSELESQVSNYIERAIDDMAKAAKLHSQLEEVYRSGMDYSEIARLPEKIVSDIENLNPKNPETGSLWGI